MYLFSTDAPLLHSPRITGLIDKLIHPHREPEHDDPGRPFTPPPPQPSKDEDDDDRNGPRFPMDPVPA